MSDSAAAEAVKVAPPIAVSVAHIIGYSVPEVVSVLTLIYIASLLVERGYKFFRWLHKSWTG